MKLPGKKSLIIGASALLVATGSITVLALNGVTKNETPKSSQVEQPKKSEQKQASAQSVSEAPTQQPASAPAPDTPPTPEPEPTPTYGEDPNNPGLYIVFDKTALMDSAGISSGDRQYVQGIVKNWIYKGPLQEQTLCGALPKAKMSVTGPDYETNPVTQLKWCDFYAKGRYGSWQAAYDSLTNGHGF